MPGNQGGENEQVARFCASLRQQLCVTFPLVLMLLSLVLLLRQSEFRPRPQGDSETSSLTIVELVPVHPLLVPLPPSVSGNSNSGAGLDVEVIPETPAPDVVASSSLSEQLRASALARAKALPKDPCDYQKLAKLVNWTGTAWSYDNTTSICEGLVSNPFPLPVDGPSILRAFAGKRIVFMGDSVARNSFVLTMARMCNEEHMHDCITRMPTVEFDVTNPPWNRGPMGCVPVQNMSAVTRCYQNGSFANVPLKGLTLRSVPQDRNGRRNFIRKGLIGPVMAMNYGSVTLAYLPVTKPPQLLKAGLWMARNPNSFIHGDVIVVSIGPHLSFGEVRATPSTLLQGLTAVRAVTSAPIVAAEFVHALGTIGTPFGGYVDELMATLKSLYEPIGVTMAPQRFVTRRGFVLKSGNVKISDQGPQKGCGYYDAQHPALRCQMVTSNMLLATAIGKLEAMKKAEPKT